MVMLQTYLRDCLVFHSLSICSLISVYFIKQRDTGELLVALGPPGTFADGRT